MITWLKTLFTPKNRREKHTFLTKQEVKNLEAFFDKGTRTIEDLQSVYKVSKTTLYRVQAGTHRFSTKDK